ncbi:MAG: tetratricopeptide repeat protein [Anaerolineales bacterium]|jgi:tetratricopeptide (TPR) repeat protein
MPGSEQVFQKTMNQGHSYAWDQEWQKAANSYRKALEEMPNNPKALSSLGLALLQSQQFDEALQIYKRVAQVSPTDPVPFERVAQLSERLGQLKQAADAAMKAAELYLNNRDIEKAIENWGHVTMLNPEHIIARSRLALTHEKLGHTQQSVTEYLAVASLLQRGGKLDKAAELVNKAMRMAPTSAEAKQAQKLLRNGQLLPKPLRPRGGTAPLMMSQVKQLNPPTAPVATSADPIAEARQNALTTLAEVLFEYSDESPDAQTRRGLSAIVRGTGQLSLHQAEQTRIVLHLSQAIDAQTKDQESLAADEFEGALEAGFDHPALFFNLGLLRSKTERTESALRYLGHAVKHVDFALGARLLMGQLLNKMGRTNEASVEYLEALKLADAMIVPEDFADEIRQLYEPIIEAQATNTDNADQLRLCKNVQELLVRENWRNHLLKAREQLPKTQEGETPLPIAEVIIQAQSSQVLDAISQVNQLARQGKVRSAMEEAFHALQSAPTYLPLHSLIGDLLVREGLIEEAIEKYTAIASAYGVRGESNQATKVLRRVTELAPMDLKVRTRLIDQLIVRGEVDEAINEYLEVADIYYRLAELDMARKTYTNALRVVQQANADRSWNVHILQRMADIDMQRLDWKQAMRVFEQIRTLRPDNENVRKNLIDLNLRLAQQPQAIAELENYLSYLETNGNGNQKIPFLEELVKEHEDRIILRRALAQQYKQAGQTEAAIAQLDAIGEIFVEQGENEEAANTIQQILLLNPPNADDYRQLLSQLQN